MRVIERSEYRDENGQITLRNRIQGTLRFGFPWYGVMQAQAVVSDRLNKSLSNDYHLLRNILIPGSGVIVSLVLVGPQGVFTILPTPTAGVFRAKDDEWLSHSGGHFRPARPNLQQSALSASAMLLQYFQGAGYALPQVESVLIFTNPQAHVDTVHPQARIVLADAVEHFAGNLREQAPIMDREDAQLLIESLIHPPQPKAEEVAAPPAPPRPLPASAVAPASAGVGPFQLEERKVPPRPRRRRGGLGRREVLLLATMVVIEVCILAAFAVMILYPDLLS